MVRLALVLTIVLGACASGEGQDTPNDARPDTVRIDACVPTDETCNDADDDCDGLVDETFETKASACIVGLGACSATGHFVCAADGADVMCDAVSAQPSEETCDSIDNDCDDKTDEAFMVGKPCDGVDNDTCADGVMICDGAAASKCNDGLDNSAELCDTFDNDCDGQFDEGFGLGVMCDGGDTDSCKEGTVVCNGQTATKCTDVTTSTVEKCNGLDDDCINGIDDTFPVGQTCQVGLGLCQRTGQYVCAGNGASAVCNAVAGAPVPEICGDGLDQDCNGADVACPANDAPANAIDVSAGGTWTVDLSTARDDNWENNPTLDCGEQGGRDVFYQFTLPAEEVVYFDLFGSNFDSVLRLYPGACSALGSIITCSDDACSPMTASQVALDLTAGTYCVVADQFKGAVTNGSSKFTFLRGGRAGTKLPNASGSVAGTTTGKEALSIGSCEANSPRPEALHFWASCPGTQSVSANTCTGTTWDTVLYMRSGAWNTTDIACSDDSCTTRSRITSKTVSGANLQWIIVDGFGTVGEGAYSLGYTIN